jgi:hypothetical protein
LVMDLTLLGGGGLATGRGLEPGGVVDFSPLFQGSHERHVDDLNLGLLDYLAVWNGMVFNGTVPSRSWRSRIRARRSMEAGSLAGHRKRRNREK